MKAIYQKEYTYLVPKGRDGLFWDPEIKDVITKYGSMGVDISNPDVQSNIVKEIAEAIRSIPLETISLSDPPVRHVDEAKNDFYTFPDGSTTQSLKDSDSGRNVVLETE